MASSSSKSKSLEDVCAALTLDEEENYGLILEGDGMDSEDDYRYILVGKLLTEKPVKFNFMKETLAGVWRPGKGMTVSEVADKLYLFQFFHEIDMKRILEDGPWAYEQSLLVLKKLELHQSPFEIQLTKEEFWVQIHNLPVGYSSEKVMKAIGNYVGEFVKVDKNSFDGTWKAFQRVRVSIDITKPLMRKMKIKKAGGNWSWIEFKYERLPTFCFTCGLLGHGERFCPKLFEGLDSEAEKPYGPWLRASNRRVQSITGQRWLVSELPRRQETDKLESQKKDKLELGDSVRSTNDKDQSGEECRQGTCMPSTRTDSASTVLQAGDRGKETIAVDMDLGPYDHHGPNHSDGLMFIEQKRRRTETNCQKAEPNLVDEGMSFVFDGSKNCQGAGPVPQDRPEK